MVLASCCNPLSFYCLYCLQSKIQQYESSQAKQRMQEVEWRTGGMHEDHLNPVRQNVLSVQTARPAMLSTLSGQTVHRVAHQAGMLWQWRTASHYTHVLLYSSCFSYLLLRPDPQALESPNCQTFQPPPTTSTVTPNRPKRPHDRPARAGAAQ